MRQPFMEMTRVHQYCVPFVLIGRARVPARARACVRVIKPDPTRSVLILYRNDDLLNVSLKLNEYILGAWSWEKIDLNNSTRCRRYYSGKATEPAVRFEIFP